MQKLISFRLNSALGQVPSYTSLKQKVSENKKEERSRQTKPERKEAKREQKETPTESYN
jgi:hypothetical protein